MSSRLVLLGYGCMLCKIGLCMFNYLYFCIVYDMMYAINLMTTTINADLRNSLPGICINDDLAPY